MKVYIVVIDKTVRAVYGDYKSAVDYMFDALKDHRLYKDDFTDDTLKFTIENDLTVDGVDYLDDEGIAVCEI